jgi:hypothetical protein
MSNSSFDMAVNGIRWRKGQVTCQERKQVGGTLPTGPGSTAVCYAKKLSSANPE